MGKNNQQFSPADLANAMDLLKTVGMGQGRPNGNQGATQRPQYIPPNPGAYAPAQPYPQTQPQPYQQTQPAYQPQSAPAYPGDGQDDGLILQMVAQIEGNLRPEGVEELWLRLGSLILHRKRINRFDLLKGIGFYTLSFCLPWLVIKAMWFGKSIAGTAFFIVGKSVFPFAALTILVWLMVAYRRPTQMLTLIEATIGFLVSLIIFSLL